MSKEEKPWWVVTVEIDYATKEYRGSNIVGIPTSNTQAHLPQINVPYIQVQADDEIGAFNEAQKVLQRLGFRVGA